MYRSFGPPNLGAWWLLVAGMGLLSCEVDEPVSASNGDDAVLLCEPTGAALGDTGIVFGPTGCTSLGLQALEEGQAWVLQGTWPIGTTPKNIVVFNDSTGDYWLQELVQGDVSMTTYVGTYHFDGLAMNQGENSLTARVWSQGFDEQGRPFTQDIEEWAWTVTVFLEGS